MSSGSPSPAPRRRHVIAPDLDRALTAVASRLAGDSGFVLMGGTALAEFYLGHRPSDDLDFFTLDSQAFADAVRDLPSVLEQEFPGARILREHSGPTFARFRLDSSGVAPLEFERIRDSPPRFAPTHTVGGRPVASLLDIAEGKLEAFVSRREGKDAVDLWALQMMAGVPLAAVYPLVYAKDPGLAQFPLSIAVALRAAASSPPLMPPTFVDVTVNQLQEFFAQEYELFIRSGLPPSD